MSIRKRRRRGTEDRRATRPVTDEATETGVGAGDSHGRRSESPPCVVQPETKDYLRACRLRRRRSEVVSLLTEAPPQAGGRQCGAIEGAGQPSARPQQSKVRPFR